MADTAQITASSQSFAREYKPVSSWFFPHPIVWAACALLIIIEILWMPSAGFSFDLTGSRNLFIKGAVFLISGMVLSRFHWDRLAILAFTLAFFTISGTPYQLAVYLAHDLSFPWVDAQLAHLDSLIGFDWLSHLSWMNEHVTTAKILLKSYDLLMFFVVLTGLSLLILNKLEKLREFIMTYAISLIITIFIGIFLPARGTYYFHQPGADLISNIPARSGRYFLDHMISLHDGTMSVVKFDEMVGLITFPSFHMVMALLMMWATRGTIVFPIFVLFNVCMAMATSVFGGHYLVDLLGGGVITVLSIWIYYLWSGRRAVEVETAS